MSEAQLGNHRVTQTEECKIILRCDVNHFLCSCVAAERRLRFDFRMLITSNIATEWLAAEEDSEAVFTLQWTAEVEL